MVIQAPHPRRTAPPVSETKRTSVSTQPVSLTSEIYRRAFSQAIGALGAYSITQLNYLRNGIFAQAGLDFSQSNPMLHKRFSHFDWYEPKRSDSGAIYAAMSPVQKRNIQKLLAEEKRRGGGLVLADFYRVHTRPVTQAYLARYDKTSLRILRNSLIARYGYRVQDPQLEAIYKQMPWYHPSDISSSDVLDHKMTAVERANIRQIVIAEHAR
jgi:hypothetical protein